MTESTPGLSGRPHSFPCPGCGARLRFRPATGSLGCDHCGTRKSIPASRERVVERDLLPRLAGREAEFETEERRVAPCAGCGARSTFEPGISAAACPFCGGSMVLSEDGVDRQLRPQGILPFAVDPGEARKALRRWVRSRWLAPSDFKRWTRIDGGPLTGVYVPYLTFDALVETEYTGSRGEHYWVEETYTTTDEDGNEVTRTRQVRKTRWHAARGTVLDRFDDILVLASRSLPGEYARELEPWDMDQVTDYRPEYVAGFRAESYQLSLEEGLELAEERMEGPIRTSIRRDIGGDEQRISSTESSYREATFKYLLLPVWLGAYRYGDRAYRILVNARTGEVQGERPWSAWKIAALVLFVAAVAAAILYGVSQS